MRLNRSFRGFSLPELVIVIAIIVVLATILIVFFAHVRDEAATATCESNERTIAEALESYGLDNGYNYPSGLGVPVNAALFGGPGNPYLNRDIVDPANGQPYLYSNGPGSCPNPDAVYQIIDQGGHSSASLIALLAADNDQDSIAFCEARGLYAFQSGFAAASQSPHK